MNLYQNDEEKYEEREKQIMIQSIMCQTEPYSLLSLSQMLQKQSESTSLWKTKQQEFLEAN